MTAPFCCGECPSYEICVLSEEDDSAGPVDGYTNQGVGLGPGS